MRCLDCLLRNLEDCVYRDWSITGCQQPDFAGEGDANQPAGTARSREIVLRAERRLGEMLAAMEKNTGTAGQAAGRDSSGSALMVPPEDDALTLKDLGIDRKQSSRRQKVARVGKEAKAN